MATDTNLKPELYAICRKGKAGVIYCPLPPYSEWQGTLRPEPRSMVNGTGKRESR